MIKERKKKESSIFTFCGESNPAPILAFPRRGKGLVLPPSRGDIRRTEGGNLLSSLVYKKDKFLMGAKI